MNEILDWRGLVPNLADYFGLWSMPERHVRVIAEQVLRLDMIQHVTAAAQNPQALPASTAYRVVNRTAIVELNGMLMKGESSLGANTSTVAARRQVRAAARDQAVDSIVLRIDSPGGTHAGTKELADDIAAANEQKPVTAFIEDIGASAAYWAAAAAGRVYANATAFVGSIGTYMAVADTSEAAENEGVKVHLLSTGPFKGAGTPGTEITEEQLAAFQQTVDEAFSFFADGVAKGRGLTAEQVREVADGRLFIAAEAEGLGLIDGVRTFDEVLEQEQTMSEKTEAPTAATFEELKTACPGADPDFLCECLENSRTIDEAREAFLVATTERAQAAEARAAEAVAQAEAAEAKAAEAEAKAKISVGVNPVVTSTGGGGGEVNADNPVAAFDALVAARMEKGLTRREAIVAAARDNRELHKQYLLACQTTETARQIVNERE